MYAGKEKSEYLESGSVLIEVILTLNLDLYLKTVVDISQNKSETLK